MENSWQIKCGSSTQPMASSTSLETRNQGEMDSGYCFYPHGTHGLRSSGHGKVQDSSVSNIRIGSSCRQGNAELGNSFLALLSAPPSLLQCDFKEQSNLKSFNASSSKLPFDGGVVISTSVGSGVPPIANGLLSECQSNQNVQNGASPIFSSRVVAISNCSTKYGLHDGLETVNVSLQSSDLAKAIIHQLASSNERAKDFSSIKGKWHNTSLGHAAKIPSSCIPISHKEPLQSNSSLPFLPSACTSECPRVICLGARGNLLLSNTGLLGIFCSCHHFHTSVAKFCEIGTIPHGTDLLYKEPSAFGRFPFGELYAVKKPDPENKDGSDTEDDEEDDDDDAVEDPDDEDGEEEDGFGEEGEDNGDPEDEPEANGDGASGDDDDEEEDDDDDDGEEEDDDDDEEDEDEDEEEIPQPPTKKRK